MIPSLLALLAIASSSVQADTFAIRAGRVLDLRTGRVEENVTLLIRDGIITARGPRLTLPSGIRIVDASQATLLAGLIDAHVHLTIAGRPRDNAAKVVRAGFTTVADLGSANGLGVRLKRLIDADSVVGPTMIAGGSWIGGKGGVCEFGGATIRGATEADARAAGDLAAGAGLLKVCLSGWLNDAAIYPDSVEMTREEIAAVFTQAEKGGVPIVAHAISQAGVRAAMTAGIRLLAHTPIVDSATARALAANGTCIATTMTTLLQADSAAALRASFQRLRRAGVRLIMGTDGGVLPHGNNAEELVTLASLGMTPLEVLRSASTVSAECLRLPAYGSLDVGAPADIVAVNGDPLRDLGVLKAPLFVIRRGRSVTQ
jgi:imidazolonepropionase-like amidohydrolase